MPEGANQEAHIMLLKSKAQEKDVMTEKSINKESEQEIAKLKAELDAKKSIEADIAKIRAESEALQAENIAKAARIEALEKHFKLEKIKADINATGAAVDVEAVAKSLLAAAPEFVETMHTVLKQLASAQTMLTKSAGATNAQSIESDVETKIAVIAKQLRTNDPSLTAAKAEALAWQLNPELYTEYKHSN